MDPLVACSLAGNVLQFLALATKVVSCTRDLLTADGIATRHAEIGHAIVRLQSLSEETIRAKSVQHGQSNNRTASTHERHILEVAKSCIEHGKELKEVLKLLQARKGRLWDSFYKAIRTIWDEDKISALASTLATLQSELMLHFIVEIQDRQSLVGNHLLNLTSQESEKTRDQIKASHIELLTTLEELKTGAQSKQDVKVLSQQLLDLNFGEQLRRDELELAFLNSLYLPRLDERRALVPEAYNKTFEWLISNDPGLIGFMPWVVAGSEIFWITGKPGSGKSTLMKFIEQRHEVNAGLLEWAGGSKLVFASFYFWISGSSVQKSLQGLFRSLLHTILKNNRELIPKLFPWRWSRYVAEGRCLEDWSEQEFVQAIEMIEMDTIEDTKFCFFIDGLDEFEGDHHSIIRRLEKLARASHVKICISSREWPIFQDAFEHRPRIRMQDLTRDDIRTFVTAELSSSPTWTQLKSWYAQRAEKIVAAILTKAHGVFLWVYLVIKSICEGLEGGDTIENLEELVTALPDDLNVYFTLMLREISQKPGYLRQAQKYFMVALDSGEPQLLWTYTYLDEVQAAMDRDEVPLPGQMIDMGRLQHNCDATRRRIKNRCKELLDVCLEPSHGSAQEQRNDTIFNRRGKAYTGSELLSQVRVSFLHRTVHDFLKTEAAKTILKLPPQRDAYVAALLLRSGLQQLQEFPQGFVFETQGRTYGRLFESIIHRISMMRESNTQEPPAWLWDQLETTAIRIFQSLHPDQRPWFLHGIDTEGVLAFVVNTQCYEYLAIRLQRGDYRHKDCTLDRLLILALGVNSSPTCLVQKLGPDLRIVGLLLDKGARSALGFDFLQQPRSYHGTDELNSMSALRVFQKQQEGIQPDEELQVQRSIRAGFVSWILNHGVNRLEEIFVRNEWLDHTGKIQKSNVLWMRETICDFVEDRISDTMVSLGYSVSTWATITSRTYTSIDDRGNAGGYPAGFTLSEVVADILQFFRGGSKASSITISARSRWVAVEKLLKQEFSSSAEKLG